MICGACTGQARWDGRHLHRQSPAWGRGAGTCWLTTEGDYVHVQSWHSGCSGRAQGSQVNHGRGVVRGEHRAHVGRAELPGMTIRARAPPPSF